VQHREFAEGSGEMSGGEFEAFLSEMLGHAADQALSGSVAWTGGMYAKWSLQGRRKSF